MYIKVSLSRATAPAVYVTYNVHLRHASTKLHYMVLGNRMCEFVSFMCRKCLEIVWLDVERTTSFASTQCWWQNKFNHYHICGDLVYRATCACVSLHTSVWIYDVVLAAQLTHIQMKWMVNSYHQAPQIWIRTLCKHVTLRRRNHNYINYNNQILHWRCVFSPYIPCVCVLTTYIYICDDVALYYRIYACVNNS